MKKGALRVEDLSYTYSNRNKPALSNVTLEFQKGKITALLGPNGSGKTTLLDCMLGWKKPEYGRVYLQGTPVHEYKKRERAKLIGLVPQNEPIQFSFSLIEYLLFGRAPYLPQMGIPGVQDYEIAFQAMKETGIEHLSRRSVTELSSGERQLANLARTLTQQPGMLLLDEPTSNLDPGNSGKVLDILSRLSDRGLTVIFSTHDPSAASEIADTVIMLDKGHLITHGSTKDTLTEENLYNLYKREFKVIDMHGDIIIYHKH